MQNEKQYLERDTEKVYEEKHLCKFDEGMIIMDKMAVFLFEFFEKKFEKIALSVNAERKIYPTLLPVNKYQKTGYLKMSPQYAMFCSDVENDIEVLNRIGEGVSETDFKSYIKHPEYALSPAACLHTYIEYENTIFQEPKVFTFTQNVFRNEGKNNFDEIGRLRDYHVKEIVFIGSHQFVLNRRKEILDKTIDFLDELGMEYISTVASDHFILPQLQKYKKIQMADKSKIEIQVNTRSQNRISCASFNMHGTAFTYPFAISVKNVRITETGCVGFGIERWVIAFFQQFGDCPEQWPKCVFEEWLQIL